MEDSQSLERRVKTFSLGRVLVHGANAIAAVALPLTTGYLHGKTNHPPNPLWGISSATGVLVGSYEATSTDTNQQV